MVRASSHVAYGYGYGCERRTLFGFFRWGFRCKCYAKCRQISAEPRPGSGCRGVYNYWCHYDCGSFGSPQFSDTRPCANEHWLELP
jgi:hypothetical protein